MMSTPAVTADRLDAQLAYQLGDDGLTAATSAANIGERACPYECGQHPPLPGRRAGRHPRAGPLVTPGVGAEPMTCPPNAFQTGEAVIRLEPGQTVTTIWVACLSARPATGANGGDCRST